MSMGMACSLQQTQRLALEVKQELNLMLRIFCWEIKKDSGVSDDIVFKMENFKCPECGAEVTPDRIANLLDDASNEDLYKQMDGLKLVCPECDVYSVVTAMAHLVYQEVVENFSLLGPRETIVQIRSAIKEGRLSDPQQIKTNLPNAYYSGMMWFGGWAELKKKAMLNKWNAPQYLISDIMVKEIGVLVKEGLNVQQIRERVLEKKGVDLTSNQIRYRVARNTGCRKIPKENKKVVVNSEAFKMVEELLYDDPSLKGSCLCRVLSSRGIHIALRTVNGYKKIILSTKYWE